MSRRGTVRVPGDKSISHRALILAALATGESRLEGILQSADVRSTASVLRLLGANVPELSSAMVVPGKGLRGLTVSPSPLYAGNSGTTVRLMTGVVAASPFTSRFEGDASLSRRPMKRLADPLTAMGARFEFAFDDGLPMTVHGGRLSGISWNTRAASAQTKSAILLAGLVAGVPVSVREAGRSRDHTERMLVSIGVPVRTDGLSVSLVPVDSLSPLEMTIPGDPSSAAYLVALGILGKREVAVPEVCLNATRTGFFSLLREMNADIECVDRIAIAGDVAATVIARPSRLSSAALSEPDIPAIIDELPLVGCVAAAAGVELEVRNAGELRVKESDRISVLVSNLNAIGVRADELPDGFRVHRRRRSPLSGRVVTHGDHRIAMAFGVLAALSPNRIEIDDPRCVEVSYPGFWSDLETLKT